MCFIGIFWLGLLGFELGGVGGRNIGIIWGGVVVENVGDVMLDLFIVMLFNCVM